jgi:hypothetical protein
MTKTQTYEWWKAQFDAFVAGTEDDGIDGEALDLLLALTEIDGQEATDYDCLELADLVIQAWRTRTSQSEASRA